MNRPHARILNPTLIIVSFGCFVDFFDLFLYNALRTPSLRELGLDGEALVATGLQILNLQVAGMFLGGFLWGLIGDRIGRKKALIGSVLLYSLGSLSCAFVSSVPLYMAMRFLTGLGLAGEFGVGAILAAETLPDAKRDGALAFYASFGAAAVFAASALAEFAPWRVCYAAGGVAGLVLCLARTRLSESGLFQALAEARARRGSLTSFFKRPGLFKRWLCCVLLIMPQVFMSNFLMTLAPEFGLALGAAAPVKANIAILSYFVGHFISNLTAMWFCRRAQKRKRVTVIYMALSLAMIVRYLTLDHPSPLGFYICCFAMGLWSFYMLYLFLTVEQFGTDMRATAGTSALSAGRTMLVAVNCVFLLLRGAGFELIPAAAVMTALVFGAGFASLFGLRDTYHQGMDFVEGG